MDLCNCVRKFDIKEQELYIAVNWLEACMFAREYSICMRGGRNL
jgi:hypothetical protein